MKEHRDCGRSVCSEVIRLAQLQLQYGYGDGAAGLFADTLSLMQFTSVRIGKYA